MLITILSSSGFHARLSDALARFSAAEVKIYPGKLLSDPEVRRDAVGHLKESRVRLVHSGEEPFWEDIRRQTEGLEGHQIWLSMRDGADFAGGTVEPRRAAEASAYMERGGSDNALRLLEYLAALDGGDLEKVPPPALSPSFGLWHPQGDRDFYPELSDYLDFYRSRFPELPRLFAGLILHRHFWCVDKPLVEAEIVKALEDEGLGTIPVFISGDDAGASVESRDFLRRTFSPPEGPHSVRPSAIVKLTSVFQPAPENPEPLFVGDDSPARGSVHLFRELNVPIFQPVASHRQSLKEWEENPRGILNELSWSVAMPEFEGAVEPIFIAGSEKTRENMYEGTLRRPHPERIRRLAARVKKWADLKIKPPSERKVAFILHNAPCASVEATVGAASRLDPFMSLKNILGDLKERGYRVDVPDSPEAIIKDIMDHKAVADFRWTTVEEIVGKGGALKRLPLSDYLKWFDRYPEDVKARITEAWGKPPGEEIEGVPPAMVLDGDIVITGRKLGENALVMLQPKRGCAGARCDGRVCVILQDPLVPPPHQYLASYRWLQEKDGFGADVIVHVGAHGNLECLPGKSAGLSESCYPDLALHEAPNVYIYNADVTSDGMIAKRRSYAALVDHRQTVFKESGLYGELAEIRELLGERERIVRDGGRKRELEEMIREKAGKSSLSGILEGFQGDFDSLAPLIRRALNDCASSLIETGLHAFGKNPAPDEIAPFVYSILRFESPEEPSIRGRLCRAKGLDYAELVKRSDEIIGDGFLSGGEILEEIARLAIKFIQGLVDGSDLESVLKDLDLLDRIRERGDSQDILAGLEKSRERILGILERLGATDELGSLAGALGAGYLTPGPSALIFKGREDVLPTGRNFYSRDPSLVPTRAAWKVGKQLSEATLARFLSEEGRYPLSVSFFWISSDLVNCDGEEFSEMLHLVGAEPVWSESGKVVDFAVIPREELKRPRIDLTVRMSGIIRDSFPEAVSLLDRAVKAVAALDEEDNYVRLHTLENMEMEKSPEARSETEEDDQARFKRAASRIYSNAPGSYSGGVYYAVMASAWETEKDLADVFILHNSFVYGADDYGRAAPGSFKATLKRVDINSQKLNSDEQDFLNCGGFFSAAGGMSLAVEGLKGKKARNYLADAREPGALSVRSLSEELGRSLRARLLNPGWINDMKKHGYKGAADISRRVSNVFGWQATTGELDAKVFDELARTYYLNPENREFFEKTNPWALEEIGRRLLEAQSRGLWEADPEILEGLKENYLSLEGVLEESTEAFGGDLQGGSVDIVTAKDVLRWKEKMDSFLGR
ncbi:MAG: cobaltochelatase subunit CobN [Deltaproteobacteria bacterium]|jgi:cobaltochelatase CobN|nr:cobaltochelatase subunit CobN [Deltaproteobacteria bacterium]